ncbi:hypothetical protein DB346_10050 [Verrucomicrobia bacterium LW23]|nr:hypothetical protein DB346_10050 [Verrucomicrobia bacterium LW23]
MHPPTATSSAAESTASPTPAAAADAARAWPRVTAAPSNRIAQTLALDLTVFACVATAALCLGLLVNQFRDRPAPLIYQSKAERLNQAVALVGPEPGAPATAAAAPAQVELPARLDLAAFRRIVEEKQVLVLDARPEIFHRLGHVPGALSLPRDEFEVYYPQLQTILQPKTRPLVLYCSSPSCEDGTLVEKGPAQTGLHQHRHLPRRLG